VDGLLVAAVAALFRLQELAAKEELVAVALAVMDHM
jgi:hypothetical protein